MLRPSYSVQLGSKSYDPSGADGLISARVSMEMDGRAGSADCLVRIEDGGLGISKGDEVTVSLGYDDTTDVFTGTVDFVRAEFYTARVFALNSISKLQRTFVDKLYEEQSCGAIVTDLAGEASVSTDTVDDGVQLPYYAVDSNRSAHSHMLELARRCGFDVYSTADDSLCFKKYESSSSTTFEYGKDVISIERLDQDQIFKSVKVFGESPSSSQGSDTVHWLTKEPVEGTSGDGSQLIVRDRSVKDTDTASSVATGVLDKLSRTVWVVADVVGAASVLLNDTVEISGMPEPALNAEYQVRGLEHYLSKSKGFTTRLRLSGTSEE